ncbi:MAG: ATP-binding cassette domain-containing protein [Trebonia sp.]|uniref:ABC transporter ATP-binding protein n=1 Tax=Trebonia sp. TaxID=2767075 RepID=UPI003C83FF00
MQATIEVSGLRKRFGPTLALDGMSFTVQPGQVTGFVGPNGAGKSTTMRVILGLDAADGGKATVGGTSYASLRQPMRVIGSLLDAGALQPSRSARNHLLWLAHSQGLDAKRVDEVIEQAGLQGVARRRAGGYSLGMRQRLGLAAALVRRPRLLILDEPTNGLDPRGIRDIRDLLTGLNADGVTVFMSSHLLPEVSALCTRIGVLDSGKLVLQEQLASLQEPTGRVLISTDDPERAVATLDGLVERRDGADLVVRSADPAALNARLVAAGVPVRSLAVQRRSLEEIVLDLTGAGSDQFGVPA